MTPTEATSLMQNADRKVYTPLDEASPPSESADEDRAFADTIAALKASLDRELANQELDLSGSFEHMLSIIRVLWGARETIEALAETQSTDKWLLSFDAEANAKKLMYAEKHYDDLLADAVNADLADLLVRMIGQRVHDEASLELLYELSAWGSVDVQNALYYAASDSQSAVLEFLLRHLEKNSTNIVAIMTQVCMYHHSQWQAMMHVPVTLNGLSLLDVVLARVAGIPSIISSGDVPKVVSWMTFLCEACQGPSEENQLLVASSDAVTIVRDFVMDGISFGPGTAETLQMQVQKCAAEVLLILMEGRADGTLHERLAAVMPVSAVVERLQVHYRAIEEWKQSPAHRSLLHHTLSMTKSLLHTDTSKDELQRNLHDFHAAIHLFCIVLHLLHDKQTIESYRTQWYEALANPKAFAAVAFFQREVVSIEIARNGAILTTYFLRPPTAKYLNETLRAKLIDHMDIGGDRALDVLTSDVANCSDVEEELTVIQGLVKNPSYSIMNKWHVWLRKNMLRLCFYINFVMLLCVQVNHSTVEDVHQANMRSGLWVVGTLGFVLLGVCAALWLYHALTTFCFNYCKQHVSPLKLSFTTSSDYWASTLHGFGAFAGYLEFFVAIFLVIFYMNMVTTTTKILAAVSVLWLFGAFLQGVRHVCRLYRFTVNVDKPADANLVATLASFWYSVLYDTLLSGSVITFGAYTLCAICGLGLSIPAVTMNFDVGPWGLMFFGFPLVDILATNDNLRFIATAMHSNMGKLGVTAVFGAIMIYLFSLVGFFHLQAELESEDHTVSHCSTLLQCYTTYIRYGLLSGGGIGDYISSTLSHELDFGNPGRYFERLVYDLAFFVLVITLFLNMVQGIIIDAFTAVREQTETKAALKRERCLVCNRSRSAIENLDGGHLNNFSRHIHHVHNFFHYFFYIQHVKAKQHPKELSGLERYVVEKLKAHDMAWIPRV
ncbi:hypothetical protein DYB30_001778 [Aphanomyces astaci]|uniref:Ion transport domain-containing protein n=1 Tax=Aphanomyces astaci TaxID=112090 RepID=A0A397DBX0_APHAT|nr:hypothetical protein DYB30_001778 [Aphanomyces astaci]